ncbi:SPOR domain-containing protein [Silvibacterium acidisoli]|uniref:SPOR domain-containing protein n=1 Tax=Acidobacteriaceae bacterium ZG23-2 TaxID=2883246 RepID=UPI00406D116A
MARMMLDEDEEIGTDTEITLGMKSVLGIFFGLVLICGVFFGFGFSMGRGNNASGSTPASTESAKSATTKTPAAAPSATAAPTVVEETNQDDASAGNETPAAPAPKHKPSAEISEEAPAPKPTPVLETAPAARAVPAVATLSPARSMAASVTTAVAQTPVMVQIAAVSRQEDANILVGALRKKGYTATVRNEPGNNFLHVQLGPFANRDEAKAMRTKLLADGYNAILK